MPSVDEALAEYLTRSDDELYAEIGAQLLKEGRGLGPSDDDRQRKFGKDWFANQLGRLRRVVCAHTAVSVLVGAPTGDRTAEALAIFEALANENDLPVSRYILAVLLARIGLQQFCAVDEDDED
ncbi:hypothetical protein [Micromonospora sp. NPDC048898]|uniref:hypothetical protein n=1 Tax=Micromonospora sp. NPDC048898 TaxID=3364260 RepID=UPI003715C377